MSSLIRLTRLLSGVGAAAVLLAGCDNTTNEDIVVLPTGLSTAEKAAITHFYVSTSGAENFDLLVNKVVFSPEKYTYYSLSAPGAVLHVKLMGFNAAEEMIGFGETDAVLGGNPTEIELRVTGP